MKHKYLLTLMVLAVALATSLQAQFTIANPSFENPNNNGSSPFPLPANWSLVGSLSDRGVIDQSNLNIPPAADGTQWLFITADGSAGGVASESIGPSSASDTFTVSFVLGENQATGPSLPTVMDAFVQGSNNGFSTNTNSFSSQFNPSTIIGTGNTASHSVTIASPGNFADARIGFRFLNAGSSNGDQVLIDNVSVIPEPSAYALLAGCTGLLFVMLRRRRG